ncbi:M56 family metallopeptidase, partial [Xanthovirga aplysinae]|uniref:M56 family metallopeptidase n=1 Tax=Xanthovirga aplysinae TaxID=2529853 RepID=UPI0012BC0FDD
MNPIKEILSDRLIHALGWTIIHSLWQGVLIVLLSAFLMILLYRQSSNIRYFVSVTALLLLFFTSATTFFREFRAYDLSGKNNPAQYIRSSTVSEEKSRLVVQEKFPDKERTTASSKFTPGEKIKQVSNKYLAVFLKKYQAYFEPHIPLISILWLLGFGLLFLRFFGSLAYSRRLKHYRTKEVEGHWQNKLDELIKKLKLKKAVRLVESSLVKVPLVIGYFKPVILLPLGLISQVPTAQLEAILAHELAHVYRRDYLVNILLTFIETFFFYHPAVWWLSNNIRAERENCCDDLALSVCNDSLTYAKALAKMQELQLKGPQMAMGFVNKRSEILQRIGRIVNNKNVRPDFSEGFITACAMMFSVIALSINAKAFEGGKVENSFRSATEVSFKMPNSSESKDIEKVKANEKNRNGFFPLEDAKVKESLPKLEADSLKAKKKQLVVAKFDPFVEELEEVRPLPKVNTVAPPVFKMVRKSENSVIIHQNGKTYEIFCNKEGICEGLVNGEPLSKEELKKLNETGRLGDDDSIIIRRDENSGQLYVSAQGGNSRIISHSFSNDSTNRFVEFWSEEKLDSLMDSAMEGIASFNYNFNWDLDEDQFFYAHPQMGDMYIHLDSLNDGVIGTWDFDNFRMEMEGLGEKHLLLMDSLMKNRGKVHENAERLMEESRKVTERHRREVEEKRRELMEAMDSYRSKIREKEKLRREEIEKTYHKRDKKTHSIIRGKVPGREEPDQIIAFQNLLE